MLTLTVVKNVILGSSKLDYPSVMLFIFQEPQSDNLDDSKELPTPTESDDIKTLEARLLEVTKENELSSVKKIQQVRLLHRTSI